MVKTIKHLMGEFELCYTSIVSVGVNYALRDQLEITVVIQVQKDKILSYGGDSREMSNMTFQKLSVIWLVETKWLRDYTSTRL